MSEPVTTTASVDSDILRQLLEKALPERQVVRLDRRPSLHASSSPLEELNAHLDDGSVVLLHFKDLSPDSLSDCARQAKPTFLRDPLREIAVYQTILASAGLGTARCFGTVIDPRGGRFGLLLERIAGAELYQVGDIAVWEQAARWLADLHNRFSGSTQKLLQVVPLVKYDKDFYHRWFERMQTFAPRGATSREWASVLSRLSKCYERVVQRLIALPVTLLHGEFYASNILVQPDNLEAASLATSIADLSRVRVCPIDWEMAAVGPGVIDLAALTAGKWTQDERRAMTLVYHARLSGGPSSSTSLEEVLKSLDYCRLHLAVQWLGWSPSWSAPAEHTHDWFGELCRLLEKLGW